MSLETTLTIREETVSPVASQSIESKSVFRVMVDTICEIAQAFFDFLKWLVSPITRYMGSKSWSIPGAILRTPWALFKRTVGISCDKPLKEEIFGSGYDHHFEKRLTPDEAKEFYPYIWINAYIHGLYTSFVEPLGYSVLKPAELHVENNELEKRENCFFDPDTGLKIGLLEKGDEVVIAFGALHSPDSELKFPEDEEKAKSLVQKGKMIGLGNWFGFVPEIYGLADRFTRALLASPELQGKKITFTGHCFGGALASYTGLKNDRPVYGINPLQLGVGLQQDLGEEALGRAKERVKYITVEGDWLSHSKTFAVFDQFLSTLGVGTPGNFGRGYTIPSAYQDFIASHVYVVGSISTYLGLDKRTRPEDLSAQQIEQILATNAE